MRNIGIQIQGEQDVEGFMDLNIDVQRNDEGKITQGIVIGDILEQNKALILITHPGEWKTNPTLGVGLHNMLLDHNYLAFRHRIREQFSMDGLTVRTLDLYPNKPFRIDADYKN